jgi:hypothetical protein
MKFTSCPQTSSKVNAGKEPPKATHPRPMADRRSGAQVVWFGNLVTAALTECGTDTGRTTVYFGDGKNVAIASDRSSKYVQIRLGLKAEACCPSRRIVQLATPSGESTGHSGLRGVAIHVAHVITTLSICFPRVPLAPANMSKAAIAKPQFVVRPPFLPYVNSISTPLPVNSASSSQQARLRQPLLLGPLSALAASGQWTFVKSSTLVLPISLRASQFPP